MKLNKKIISIILTIVLSFVALTGCNDNLGEKDNKDYLKGIEAAKLLLANTRLDENFASNSFNVFKNNNENELLNEKIYLSANKPDYEDDGVEGKWNNFPNASTELQAVNATIVNLENTALQFASTINEIKRFVGVTNVWVPVNAKTMLIVEENAEVLLKEYSETEYIVGRRYINGDGNNEYKFVETYDYGIVSTTFVPGKYYESMYQNKNGFTDWFIIENSRGYWNFLRGTDFDYEGDEDDCYQISNAMLLEDFCIKFLVRYYKNGKFEKNYVSITTSDMLNDVLYFNYHNNDLINSFRINANAVNGIDYFATPVSNVKQTKYTEDIIVPVPNNYYNVSLMTKNGLKIEPDAEIIENVSYEGAEIDLVLSASNLEELNVYKGIMEFQLENDINVGELMPTITETLNQVGISLKYDVNDLTETVSIVNSMIDNYNAYYKWNNLHLNNYQTIDTIYNDVYPKSWSEFTKVYHENKDNEYYTSEQLKEIKELNPNAKFTKFNSYLDGQVKLENNVITIENASATIKDLTYFDHDKNYALRYGIAKVVSAENVSLASNKGGINLISSAENIKLDDVWFLPIHTENETLTTCTSDNLISNAPLNFSASVSFNLPNYLPQGEYVFVSYIAEENEGIRLTEFKAVNFERAEKAEISSELGKYIAEKGEDGKLYFNSETALDIEVTLQSHQVSYTYEEVYKLLASKLLEVGQLDGDSQLEVFNTTLNAYEKVSTSHVFTNEKVRIKFIRKTPIGNEVAYAYCQLNIS